MAPAGGLPASSDYRSMEQRILFLLICIGKGLSWMVREVKFKAQRCFEGQWEGYWMMMMLHRTEQDLKSTAQLICCCLHMCTKTSCLCP